MKEQEISFMGSNKKAKTATEEKIVPVIYCGPNIPHKGLTQYAIFKNGIPPEVAILGPSVIGLVVKTEKLSSTKIAINQKGTRENMLYQKIKEESRKVVR